MPNLGLIPLLLVCTINPEGDGSWSTPRSVEPTDAERWGYAARITGKRQRSDDPSAPLYVALTFDDGPSETVTPRILATLDEYEVPATFFAVGWRFEGRGKRALDQAEVLREVAAAGHAIGNHTMNHRDLTGMSPREARRQIDDNEKLLVKQIGRRPYLFRAPFGRTTRKVRAYLDERGYTEVKWSIESRDYLPALARGMPERVVTDLIDERGGVVLLHDTKPWTARELPNLLDRLERENCRRRADGERLLVPVTIDYFLRERDGTPRALPDDAKAAETRYLRRLERVCASD